MKPDKPVYIHIPLKPPPGETDEFSYLEFEPRDDEAETVSKEVVKVVQMKLKDQAVIKEVQPEEDVEIKVEDQSAKEEKTVREEAKLETNEEAKPEDKATKESSLERGRTVSKKPPEGDVEMEDQSAKQEKTVTEEAKSETEQEAKPGDKETKDRSPTSTLERGRRVSKKPPLKINPAFKQLLKDVRELGNRDEQAPQQPEPETIENELEGSAETKPNENQESPKKDDVFDKLFSASASSSKPPLPKSARSKSAEPETKRRSSLESSYSRKSLSKLAIMKRLKEASDKIKNAFSMNSLRRKSSTKTKKPEEEEPKKSK